MAQQGMTVDQVLALPVSVDLETAGKAFQLGRTTSYQLAKEGRFPVPVLRAGNQYRVTRASLLRELGIAEPVAA